MILFLNSTFLQIFNGLLTIESSNDFCEVVERYLEIA